MRVAGSAVKHRVEKLVKGWVWLAEGATKLQGGLGTRYMEVASPQKISVAGGGGVVSEVHFVSERFAAEQSPVPSTK